MTEFSMPGPAESGPSATRQRLMHEALKLFANNGLSGGVSLRQIVQAAGGSNPSALHYHFGSRETLIDEIAAMLQQRLEPATLARLEALQSDGTPSVRDVLQALFGPVVELVGEPGLGRDAIRFISRLGWDFGPHGQELSAELHRASLTRAYEILQSLLPDVPAEVLKFRLILNMNNVYHGLANQSYLFRSPFGPLDIARLEQRDGLQASFFDYLEAGVRGHHQATAQRQEF